MGLLKHDQYLLDKIIHESKRSTVKDAEDYYQRLVEMQYDTKREAFMNLARFTDEVVEIYAFYNQKN